MQNTIPSEREKAPLQILWRGFLRILLLEISTGPVQGLERGRQSVRRLLPRNSPQSVPERGRRRRSPSEKIQRGRHQLHISGEHGPRDTQEHYKGNGEAQLLDS